MKQVFYKNYGPADLLQVIEAPKPSITGKGQVLVKVLYSSLNAIDWKNRKGHFRHFSGWFRPRTKQGFDVYGEVVAKASDISTISIGDRVVGQMGNLQGGALSEYVILSDKQFLKVPNDLPGEQLGGLPLAGTTAWLALFDCATIKAGDKVLINGGSSGVGHFAIQIAKAAGAEVTSVSSARNVEFCKSLGADHVIDYAITDFTTLNDKFDIIFDVVYNASLQKVKHMLSKEGVYIGTTPTPNLLWDMLTTRRAKFVAVRPNIEALVGLVRLMEQGKLNVSVDKVYPMSKIVDAHIEMEKSRTRGKIIITTGE